MGSSLYLLLDGKGLVVDPKSIVFVDVLVTLPRVSQPNIWRVDGGEVLNVGRQVTLFGFQSWASELIREDRLVWWTYLLWTTKMPSLVSAASFSRSATS